MDTERDRRTVNLKKSVHQTLLRQSLAFKLKGKPGFVQDVLGAMVNFFERHPEHFKKLLSE